jgi:hypothetical protein
MGESSFFGSAWGSDESGKGSHAAVTTFLSSPYSITQNSLALDTVVHTQPKKETTTIWYDLAITTRAIIIIITIIVFA